MKVKVDQMVTAIDFILDDYSGAALVAVEEAVKKVSSSCLQRIRRTAPRDTGRYAKSWKKKTDNSGTTPTVTLYSDLPYLPHLLENGHAKVNGGRVEGIPHIRPAVKEASEQLEQEIKRGLEALT